jgi:septal ring factor EnvC (AmiA/AmiB activator)
VLASPAAAQDGKLQSLRSRIDLLSRELEKTEANRREARDALRDSERAISEANRTLAALQAEGAQLRRESARVAERRRGLERSLAERQAAVGAMLAARQAAGAPDALRVALSGDDPGSLGRTLAYVGYVSRAAAATLAGYRAGLDEAARLAREAQAKRERLAAVEKSSRADRERIVRERNERRRVFDRLAKDIRKNRREIGALRADEARLARLVQEIGRVLARVELVPERDAGKDPFSSLRGRLRLPVRGELSGRFGTPRGGAGPESKGIESKGVFIRAPGGQPVRAVGRGQVVFADWMRGFGNLLIVDHGENYLSIYANAEALLKQVGEPVGSGEAVATTGSSGGNEETGLYFELRHEGRAFDPLRWVRLR